jgi:SOS-response transcriptional repressor LexA
MSSIVANIKALCAEQGISVFQLERTLNFGNGSINKWDTQCPSCNRLRSVARYFHVSCDYLFGETKVRSVLAPISIVPHEDRPFNSHGKIPLFDSSVSAGGGVWLDEHIDSDLISSKDIPHGTDFALRISGDSMEPMYLNGEIVFVRKNVIVESGQIGVFSLNDESYLKMLQGNRLVSLNSKYRPIVIDEEDRFYCIGRVIGKTTSDNLVY